MTPGIGVGFVGAGPVVQSIHLPTLARLGEVFRIVALTDPDTAVATAVARRAQARAVDSLEELLADPEVDVVAVCSPQDLHAEQVEAACRAGARAVLCEKPLAVSVSEAQRIAEVARATNTPILVGAMHTHDPGWTAVTDTRPDLLDQCRTVRSEIVLPPNERFVGWATELASPPATGSADTSDPDYRSAMIRAAVLGLTVHDLPLVRRFLGRLDEVDLSRFVAPFGYLLSIRGNGRTAELLATMHGGWHTRWVLEAWGDTGSLRVDFTPSFVHAGSAVSTVVLETGSERFGPFPRNGYEEQWLELARVCAGAPPRYDLDTVVADAAFTAEIAEAAAALVRTKVSS